MLGLWTCLAGCTRASQQWYSIGCISYLIGVGGLLITSLASKTVESEQLDGEEIFAPCM